MYSSMGKARCSFAVAVRWELAVVASTAVVAGAVGHVVEVDRLVVVVVEVILGGSVLEMVPRRNCCGWFAAVDRIEGVRSAACFGCSMLRRDLP